MLDAAREALAAEPEGIRERVRLFESDGRDTGVHFLPGSFDVVLCHGVLMYVERAGRRCWRGWPGCWPLAGCCPCWCATGTRSPCGRGLAGDWAAALAAFDTDSYTNRLGLDVRADRLSTLTATLAGIGAPLQAWYGVRVFTDTASDEAEVPRGRGRAAGRRGTGRAHRSRTGRWPRCCTCAGFGVRRFVWSTAGWWGLVAPTRR